jgi:hypothetical protein
LTNQQSPTKDTICSYDSWKPGVRFLRSLLASFLSCCTLIGAASAQSPIDRAGGKHLVTAAIVPANIGSEPEPRISDLQVTVRISDHARESQYFGNVPVTWPEFAAAEGAPQQKIWEDVQCHQRRGLPTATIIAIDGTRASAQSHFTISARHRHIGLMMPSDEIKQAQSLPAGRDDLGRYLAFRIETAASRLIVLLKIYVIDCALT